MQKFFVILPMLLLQFFTQAQERRCWDFEEQCPNPGNAFFTGCIPDAFAQSGTPDIGTTSSLTVPSGSKYAHTYIRHCDAFYSTSRIHGEGFVLENDFVAGHKYELKFWARRGPGNTVNPILGIYLTNTLGNFGGADPGAGCNSLLDVVPAVPADHQSVANLNPSAIPATEWKLITLTFTAAGNFSQLWFRPTLDLTALNPSADFESHFYYDDICVSDITCRAPEFKLSLCRQGEEGKELLVTINGAEEVPTSDWLLLRLKNCNAPGFASLSPINWVSNNSFTVPANSGCYVLAYLFENEFCEPQYIQLQFNTNADNIPICDACVDWSIVADWDEYCKTFLIEAQGAGSFPPGTQVSASIEGKPATMSGTGFYYPEDGPWGVGVIVCFTVDQPNCPPVTQCATILIPEPCDPHNVCKGRSNSAETAVSEILFTNPADQFLRFNQVLEGANVQIYSMQGALMRSLVVDGANQISVSDLPDGQYLLAIQHAGKREAKLLMVMHRP